VRYATLLHAITSPIVRLAKGEAATTVRTKKEIGAVLKLEQIGWSKT
jgi:hypothetical protein